MIQEEPSVAGVANPNGSGEGVEVGVFEPRWPVAGQASGVNAVGHQTDTVVPFLEPMICVTNRNQVLQVWLVGMGSCSGRVVTITQGIYAPPTCIEAWTTIKTHS